MRPWTRVAAGLFAIGYGANQFSPLMVAYREQGHFSALTVAAFFGVYAAGLAPGLLIGGPASDRRGRRLLLPALVVSVPASAVLALGAVPGVSEPALYVGRFLFGVVTGIAMAVGTTWVKELSQAPFDPSADPGAGARRAALALSAGFGVGPLVAGVLAQWGPLPLELPYFVHIALTVPIVLALLRVPETRPPRASTRPLRADLRIALPPRFRRVVAPMAPWVFGAPALSFAVQPAALGPRIAGVGLIYATLLTTLTLGTGVAIQSPARRMDRRSPVLTARVGLAAITAGVLLAALAAGVGSPVVAAGAAVVLGAAYGLCLVAGLLEVQRMAEPEHLAGLTAVYYVLTYVGFVIPVVLAALTGLAGYPALLLGVAALAVVSLVTVARTGRVPVA
ncbi:MFS transporter [Pseudonocardia nigra]|uniref:MFS transporter n=1 Tax=Pseudonocardia nigra TaxID=1921578 RepID=UPI001C5DF59C|nr:MFS transporter [Pseudonocardia nigra]